MTSAVIIMVRAFSWELTAGGALHNMDPRVFRMVYQATLVGVGSPSVLGLRRQCGRQRILAPTPRIGGSARCGDRQLRVPLPTPGEAEVLRTRSRATYNRFAAPAPCAASGLVFCACRHRSGLAQYVAEDGRLRHVRADEPSDGAAMARLALVRVTDRRHVGAQLR